MKIIVADDHLLYRSGLVSLLAGREGLEIVGQASDGLQAIELARALRPDLVIMDVHMPRSNGLEATRVIKREMPEIKVVMLSVSDEDEYLFDAIKSGAQGYLLKILDPRQLIEALLGICRGEATLSRHMASRILREFQMRETASRQGATTPGLLSSRELEALELLSLGGTSRQVAQRLGVRDTVVKSLLGSILDKLQDDSVTLLCAGNRD